MHANVTIPIRNRNRTYWCIPQKTTKRMLAQRTVKTQLLFVPSKNKLIDF